MNNNELKFNTEEELKEIGKASRRYTEARNKLVETLKTNLLDGRRVYWRHRGQRGRGYVLDANINCRVRDMDNGQEYVVEHTAIMLRPTKD